MKKRTIVGLGVCALAIAATVGVISTQRVQEAKAGEGDITVYFRDAEWWAKDGACTSVHLWGGTAAGTTWPGNAMTKVETKDGLNVWKYTLNTTEYKNLIFARVSSGNQDWGAKSVDIDLSTFDPKKPLYDISGQETAIWGDPGVTGTWTAYEEPAPVEPTLADGYYILGIGGWDISNVIAGDAEKGDNAFQKTNISLAAGDSFKIVKVESDAVVWESSYGFSDLKYGTGKASFVEGDKGNLEVGEGKGGSFDIYLKGGEITINTHGELPPEPTYEDGYYILGIGGWDISNVIAGDAEKGDNAFQKTNISLAAGDSFKIVKVESDALVWESSYGFSDLKHGTAKASFVEGDKGNLEVGEGKGGSFDIYLKGGEITINSHGELPPEPQVEDGWYLAGVKDGSWAVKDCLPSALSPLTTDLAQFHDVELAKDTEFKVVHIENDAITQYLGYEFFENGKGASKMDGKIVDAEGEGTNFKVETAGTYSIYLFEKDSALLISIVDENYVAGPTGYYLLQDPWTAETGTKGEAENTGNHTYFLDMNLAKDAEFVIAYFEDGVRPSEHQYDLGWSDVSTHWSAEIANFEEGTDNHIKVKTAGVYSIYVSKNVDGDGNFVCLNGSGLTPEVIASAQALADYIDEKAAESYAGLTPEQRHDGCKAKYTEANNQYIALGEAGQKYFRSNFAEQYAIYLTWDQPDEMNAGAWDIRALGGNSTALVVTLAVLAGGVAAAGAMVYFSKKRKASK